jgi:hypothetical protein
MFIGSRAKFVTAHRAVTNSSFGVATIRERPSGKRYGRGQVGAVGLIGRNLRKFKEQEREGSWSTAKPVPYAEKVTVGTVAFSERLLQYISQVFSAVLVIFPR